VGALDGLRVVEVAEGVSGPYCGKLLADLGAEVIKVERPRTGDPCRYQPPFYHDEPGPDNGLLFSFLNTSKLGVTLEVASALGRELLAKLVADADVLLVSGSPAEVEARGLGCETWMVGHPRLVNAYLTPFGLSGPYRDRVGGELVAFQMAGLGYMTPRDRFGSGRRPLKAAGNQALMAAGLTAAVAVMHALFAREASGQGQLVDVSEVEPMASFQFLNLARWWYAGDSGERGYGEGSRRIWCADGPVSFLLFTGQDQQWHAFRDLLGNPDWFEEERYRPPLSSVRPDDPLWAHVNEWAGHRSKETVYREAQARRVPLFPENTIAEAVESEQVRSRGFIQDMPLAGGGSAGAPGAPYQMSKTPAGARGPAPELGRDNQAIFCGRLGLTPEELAHAYAAAII
jgi:crotonobetainyl-CoA:carnitine CoA-transferase CaiB-like acyl-CoA transferase